MIHGTAATYRGSGCRCQPCREAHTQWHIKLRQSLRQRLANGEPSVPHGRLSTYSNWGCRCAPCVAANSAACAVRRQRRKQTAATGGGS